MRKLVWWLLAPWKGVRARYLTPRRKAILVGCVTSIGVLYGGWLLLVGKESLDDRNVVSVVVAPDRVLLSPAREQRVSMEPDSPRCRVTADPLGPAPSVEGCVYWRSPAYPSLVWKGSYRTVLPAHGEIFRGNGRGDAIKSLRGDVGRTLRWLLAPGGMLLAVLVGVSTGYHSLRREAGGEQS